MSLISVVFGYDTALNRNQESLKLLKYGFSNYKLDLVLEKGTLLKSIKHILYKNEIKLIVKEDIYYLTKRSDNFNYRYDLNYDTIIYNGNINVYKDDELIKNDEISFKDKPIKKNIWELFISILSECFI